jgi:hypothetical protein
MFRFTIRDVLWLMVVVAMALAWWVERNGRDKEWKTVHTWQEMTGVDGRFYMFHHEHREKRGSRLGPYNEPLPPGQ